MQSPPESILSAYTKVVLSHNVPVKYQAHYLKWFRFYWDFCVKYEKVFKSEKSLEQFIEKIADKGQSEFFQKQARWAIQLYVKEMVDSSTMSPMDL